MYFSSTLCCVSSVRVVADRSLFGPELVKSLVPLCSFLNVPVMSPFDGSKVTLSGSADTTGDAEKLALAVGNTQGVTQVVNNLAVAQPHAESRFYTVKPGDSLSKIAEEFYGHGQGPKYEL